MSRITWLTCIALLTACGTSDTEGTSAAAITTPFSWHMAGQLLVGGETLTASPATLISDHFSYVGTMAMNGCTNNTPPYSCAANGCDYPGNPTSSEVLTYGALESFVQSYRSAGLYAGIWGVTYTNVEAEGHCMAEIANRLKADGAAPTFLIVDGEKSFETDQSQSQRFVTQFNGTLSYALAKGYTTECHIDVPFQVWLAAGFGSIEPQAYWDDVGVDPGYCLNWLAAHGVPASASQVMLDGYRHGTPHTWDAYAQEMSAFGNHLGFNLWRSLNPDEWAPWKTRIETYQLATYAGASGCANQCAVGSKRCLGGSTDLYQDCVTASSGCTVWSTQHSCGASWPGTTCSAGYCVGGCTNQCTLGSKRCLGGSTDLYEDCVTAASGCTAWSTQHSCSASWPGTTCSAGYCVGGCTNQCTLGSKRCVGSSTDLYEDCVNGASGCTTWSQQYSCGTSWPGTHCSAGYCVGN